MNAYSSNDVGLIWHIGDDELAPFKFSGINGRIELLGDVWQFWECPGCGNATFSKPRKCEKCNGRSFEFIRLWAWRNSA